jgi:UDP-glucose 4-epimerase
MKILITGGLGYIGSHVVYKMITNAQNVVIVDNLSTSNIQTLKNINSIKKNRIKFYNSNLNNTVILNKIFKYNKIGFVIHLAAIKDIKLSIHDPIKTYDINVVDSINLIKIMQKHKVYNLIFGSSAAPDSFNNKNNKIKQFSPYGNTKKTLEKFLYDIALSNKKWNITIAKFYNVVGLNRKNFYVPKKNSSKSLFENIIKILNKKNILLKIFGKDYKTKDGTCIRDYIDVNDIAKYCLRVVKYQKNKKKNYQIFHLCNNKGYSILDVVKIFEKIFLKKIKIKYQKKRKCDIPISIGPKDKNTYLKRKINLLSTIKNLKN